MERSRLKNIIILILALVNLFLLASLGMRRYEEHSAQERTVAELSDLFAQVSVTLPDTIPKDAAPQLTLERDTDAERAMAMALLGKDLTISDEGGGIYTYRSDTGRATFHSGGSFDITGQLSADAESACRKFCRNFGYDELQLDDSGGTAVAYYGGYPVINATVTFRVEERVVCAVSGVCLPDTVRSTDQDTSMSAVTALTRFLNFRREYGAVVSSVEAVDLCYELQSTPAAPLTLTPRWRLTTDAAVYYVNCSTGEVTTR